ncbi:MAG: YdeI/OmpD-associated family protein [Brevinema sp.]
MEEFTPSSREEWRQWLLQNASSAKSIQLVYFKKHTGIPSLSWGEAVEEALCFGWIDSTVRRIDDQRHKQLFTPRKAKSTWSRVNKNLVAKLEAEGLMTDLGRQKIATAQENGWWDFLEDCHEFVIPEDMKKFFNEEELTRFHNLKDSVKFHLLVELKMKKGLEARQKVLNKMQTTIQEQL